MAKQAVARTVDLEPIDRLEQKIKLLVSVVAQLRDDHVRMQDDNARLTQELESLRSRLADADITATELVALRDERELIRTRVSEMLDQLETI